MSKVEAITKDGEVVSLSHDLGLRGRVLRVGWDLPADLTKEEWIAAGALLGKVEQSVSWWIGDWWLAYKPEWGKQAKVFAPDWQGPSYNTCRNAGMVCEAFQIARRRANLDFKHHAEVLGIARTNPGEADALLAWAAEPLFEGSKNPRSTRELRSEVSRRRVALGAQPSSDTCTIRDLYSLIESGKTFNCIYADPPWDYDNQGTRAATGNHYNSMTVDELCELPVRDLAGPNSHLHLWTTNAFLFECPRILSAWGFEYKSVFIWCKEQIGLGNYYRLSHEYLILGVRGKAKSLADQSVRSWAVYPKGRHSEKPRQVREMIQRVSPGPYLELFGRERVPGWTVWGNQIRRDLFNLEPEEMALPVEEVDEEDDTMPLLVEVVDGIEGRAP